ncbi:peroxisomal membrane protein 11A [Exaiptasia diaphana]|uniref:Peroxisomal membrane protein 11B n=1 Tax=Exaiptasia diaphana TaxID=2652724 RepID=A0A913XPG8_EXADI|nr:peroxisomal membrane protein 11A [Exaiptasia diaphana]KXJ10305.1 Peroxisomal membrane protein 11B [Exaiptasia diaphana]
MDVVSAIVKYNQQTLGRDKLCRTIQYGSRLTGYVMERVGFSKDLVENAKKLDKHASTSRKIFRLGKSMDMYVGFVRASKMSGDNVVRVLIMCRRVTYILYYLVDHVTWADRVGLFKSDSKAWSKFQSKFWLIALIFGVLRNIYDLLNLLNVSKERVDGEKVKEKSIVQKVMKRPDVVLDTVKNSADFLLPLNVMGIIQLSTGVSGLLGLISSIAGAVPIWYPELKLKPS